MLTLKRLKEVVHYDQETGVFTWQKTLSPRAVAGKRAGSISVHSGAKYRKLRIDRVLYFEHRLAWMYMTGRWPDPEIDHIDINGTNNAWRNLREADRSQNFCNRKVNKKNKTGIKGVSLRTDTGKYSARIQMRGKSVSLGCFETEREAKAAYNNASKLYHGEFGRS